MLFLFLGINNNKNHFIYSHFKKTQYNLVYFLNYYIRISYHYFEIHIYNTFTFNNCKLYPVITFKPSFLKGILSFPF